MNNSTALDNKDNITTKDKAMTTIKQLEDRIKELEAKTGISSLEVWPKERDMFYCLDKSGVVYIFCFTEGSIKEIAERGEVYRTREEAEKADRRRITEQKLRVAAGGFKPDWDDARQAKWQVCYDHSNKKIFWSCLASSEFVGCTYFKEQNHQLIKDMEAELLEYFGVNK